MTRFSLQHPWLLEIVAALLLGAASGLVHPTAALAQVTTDAVWIEDALPAGATPDGTGETWSWVSSNPAPFSGTLSHRSAIVAGVHQHWFTDATATMKVGVGDTLFTYVWLDPANPPAEIMLQWNDGSEETWNHRAYWGANLIAFGTDGTVGQRYMGPLPALGQWVKLTIPAEWVALEGTTVSGMAFALYDGRASWDRSGTTSHNQLLLRGSITSGTPTGGVAISGTNNANCSPTDAAGAYVCAVPYGWSGSITPQSNGYTFAPPSRTYSNVTAGTASDNYTVVAAVDLHPRSMAVAPSGSFQFGATKINSAALLIWSVDGIAGGNAAVGTISPTGLYTAPATTGTHAITATLQGTSVTGSATVGVNNYRGVFTYHNDNTRTGANQGELVLKPANVVSAQFGKLFTLPVDGEIYAQPLYVSGVAIPGQGVRNVVYVATQHDSVYAFDADGGGPVPLWHVNFLGSGITTESPANVDSDAYLDEIGIASTPVIDPATSTIYVVAYTVESGHYVHRLHALDLATGAEKFGGPVVVTASSPGSDDTSRNGRVPFIPFRELQRPALLLQNNVVYVAFASHGDHGPYHGWVLGYDAQNLKQIAVHNSTPDGIYGGVWMSGGGLAADASNNVYFLTGNGTFDANVGGNDYGDSFVKLGTAGRAFTLADYFTPYNEATLEATDQDISAGGIVLFTGTAGEPLAVGLGKTGTLYLVNRNSMGHYQPGSNSQITQSFQTPASLYLSVPAFWQNYLYIVPSIGGGATQYRFSSGMFGTTPVARNSTAFKFPGAVPAISSNGASNGIMWLLPADGWRTRTPAILHAYDATNIAVELYNSSQAGSRDALGPAIKFAVPTVVNGKVYVPTGNSLAIFGPLTAATSYQVSGAVSGAVVSGVGFTATGGVSCSSSDPAGHYACTVPQGWSGTVTPALTGYTFAPPSRTYANVSADQTGQNYVATVANGGGGIVWVDDALPTGATPAGDGEGWNWISNNPAPYSGTLAHQSVLASGMHQHYFTGATSTLSVGTDNALFAYVYLDSANPPRELMLQWNDGTWEHRAYWGANLIAWGSDGTVSRRYIGPLPATGQWTRLSIPATQVGLAGRTLNGMAFTVYDGRATWDYAGRYKVWVDDAVPAGATATGTNEGWNWVSSNPTPFGGTLAHQSALASGVHQHYFTGASSTLAVGAADTLFAYVYLDAANPPSEVMLQWNAGTWEHRAYWGANLIPWGTDGTPSRRNMGPLPPAGQWVRLSVPAAQVGLAGSTVNGIAFTLYNGRATWDFAGK